jgi:hypothetical protein
MWPPGGRNWQLTASNGCLEDVQALKTGVAGWLPVLNQEDCLTTANKLAAVLEHLISNFLQGDIKFQND